MLIVVTSPSTIEQEATYLASFLEEGCDAIHIRKPTWSDEQIVKVVDHIPKEYHSRIAIHARAKEGRFPSHMQLHIPERFRNERPESGYSTSVHTLSSVPLIAPDYRYVFLGPLFSSISKSGYSNPRLLGELTRTKISLEQVIAIGGINSERIKELQGLGLRGVAVLGAIWQSLNPQQSFRAIQQAYNEVFHG